VSVQPRIDLREGTPVLVRVPSEDFPSFLDDEKRESLIAAVRRGQTYYETQPPERLFSFGVDRYTARDMAEGLRDFALLVESNPPDLADRIKRAFVVYRSVGVPPDGSIVFSSYYEHSLRASLRPSKRFAYPLYARPPDLQETREQTYRCALRVGRRRQFWTASDHRRKTLCPFQC
jgi:membrane-bound lytic murein transglycosylase